MSEHRSQGQRLSPEETIARIRKAKLVEYDHGGGRLYFEEPGGGRDLIADFYGEGHYRDFIMTLLRAATAQHPMCACPENGASAACPTHGANRNG